MLQKLIKLIPIEFPKITVPPGYPNPHLVLEWLAAGMPTNVNPYSYADVVVSLAVVLLKVQADVAKIKKKLGIK